MNVLFVGGSNTRMANGYVANMMSGLRSGWVSRNISVGISGCLMGIEQLKQHKDLEQPDVVFIEYSINDVSILAKGALLFWQKSYEGLIRQLVERYPGVPLIALHFVSRIPSHAPLARQILAFQVKLAAHYGAYSVVDVASQLELQIEADDRYKDDMHYGPATWAHISELAWDEADSRLSHPSRAESLPGPLSEGAFECVELFFSDQMLGGRRSQFSNSMLDFEVQVIERDQHVELNVPGEVAAISFISTANSGILELQDRNGSHFIPTLHRDVQSGKFSSLFMNSPAVWNDWTQPVPEMQRIILRCHSVRSEPYRDFWSMVEPSIGNVEVQVRSVLIASRRHQIAHL